MKALALKPADRYWTVQELQKDIEAYQTGFATGAEKAGLGRQIGLMVKRHKGIFATLAACLVVIVVGATVFVLRLNREKNVALAAQARAEAGFG